MTAINSRPMEVVGAEVDKTGLITTGITQGVSLLQSIFGKPAPTGGGTTKTPAWIMPTVIGGIGVLALTIFASSRPRKGA